MVATKPKQKVISKRQLVKMLKRFEACNDWMTFANRAKSVNTIIKKAVNRNLYYTLGFVNDKLVDRGFGEYIPTPELPDNVDELMRAAPAYCRKHGIK